MMQPAGHHLAEFNFGVLRHDWDDPRVAEFADNLDRVNALAVESPGYVWHMSDEEMDAGQKNPDGVFGGNPRTASMLSVWADAQSLHHYVWKTAHRDYYDKRRDWFDAEGNSNLVMWWVPVDHRPDLMEGMARFNHLNEYGETDHAFGWKRLAPLLKWARKREQYA